MKPIGMAGVGVVPREFSPKRYEGEILRFFERQRIRIKRKEHADRNRKFYFLDGPPYVTNPVHVGTAWNKIIKDVVVRFKAMQGFLVRDQPGYDMHGLPIEVVVERELGTKTKSDVEKRVGLETFVDACRRKGLENLQLQNQQFIDLGVWLDWDNPYMTITNEWIESVWWLIKRADERGLLERREKVVHWCPRCETVLSHHEVSLEYQEISDPSIYVKFPLVNRQNTYILIWTTTPWTIPANLAVMVHPKEEYVEARVGSDILILAKKRADQVFREVGVEYEVLRSQPGRALDGMRYRFPLLEEVPRQRDFKGAHRVILSEEYVSMEEGTGCVHSAPGHGEEDYEVGMREGLPAFSPLDDQGRFVPDAGKYKQLFVFDANEQVIDDLRGKGLLFFRGKIRHAYPFCWRCKAKLVLRSTPQWFIQVSRLRDRLLSENEKIEWVPEWAGKARFRKWLEGVRDWVISRQRYWGTPLPIWICDSCGNRLVIGSIRELERRAISLPEPLDLHKPKVDGIVIRCDCGGTMRRVTDLVDVWMDSGVAGWACLEFPKSKDQLDQWWPSDFITEGPDQTRGWFYTLLVSGIIGFDRSPYDKVLMHGWTLDEGGTAMHKSLGNIVLPGQVVEEFGRDALRLYELQNTVWDDLKFSTTGVRISLSTLQILWNVFHFATLYMNLDGFDPGKNTLEKLWSELRPEDRWFVSRTETLKREVTENMEKAHIHVAVNAVSDFILNDLSRWYVKLVRRRFWEERKSVSKLTTYATLYYSLRELLVLCAPFIPFITEKLYQLAFRPIEGVESVHLMRWPEIKEEWVDSELEEGMRLVKEIVASVFSARQKGGLKLRQPVQRIVLVAEDPSIAEVAKLFDTVLRSQANTKSIEVIGIEEEAKLRETSVIPRYGKLGPAFKEHTEEVAEALKRTEVSVIAKSFAERGYFDMRVGRRKVRILPTHVGFKERMPEGFLGRPIRGGRVYVETKLTPELLGEGMVRDVVRRIQHLRKLLDLNVEEFVDAYVRVPANRMAWIRKFEGYVKEEGRIRDLSIISKGEPRWKPTLEKDWVVDAERIKIGIRGTTAR
ncbi:MAG: isoleucine--tRNA ligase [Candidatus Bathyarchaeia archaeon]